jgi:hypothetical protein
MGGGQSGAPATEPARGRTDRLPSVRHASCTTGQIDAPARAQLRCQSIVGREFFVLPFFVFVSAVPDLSVSLLDSDGPVKQQGWLADG